MPFAHVYVAKDKVFKTVQESEIKEVDPEKKSKLDVSLDKVALLSSEKKYAIWEENKFKRLIVCYTAGKRQYFSLRHFQILKLLRNCRAEVRVPVELGPFDDQ